MTKTKVFKSNVGLGLFVVMVCLTTTAVAQDFSGNISTEPLVNEAAQTAGTVEAVTEEEAVAQFIKEPLGQILETKKMSKEELAKAEKVLGDLSKYTLGKTDIIEINVARHPEVSGEFTINNEGKIQYQFVGDVDVEGLTKNDVGDILKELLSTYIVEPEVMVKITGYNSKIVYVIGEVGSPGKIFMRGDTITVREALMQAGLPLLSAKTTRGSLITPSANGKANQEKVNVHKLLFEGDLRENLVMKPGDVFYLPPTVMAKALRVIQPVAAPIGVGRTVATGF